MSHPPSEIHESDRFGYIPFSFRAHCGDYLIEPLPDLDARVKAVEANSNRDGYYYPGERVTVTVDPASGEEIPIPRTTRPAFLHKIPATHMIRHRSGAPVPPSFRNQEGALMINLLALLYRTRCQFWDWWFDMRVRVKRDRVAWFRDDDGTVSSVLNRVFEHWSAWPNEAQVLFSNALWIHSRASSYEWDWERFLMRYMTLDAAWAASRCIHNLVEPRHAERIAILCDRYGLVQDEPQAAEFVRLRNGLFHEALWDRNRPSTVSSGKAAMAEIYLGEFNSRLLLAIGGVRGEFVRSTWISIDITSLEFE